MKDIGIDLGTTNVLIYIKDEGIVLNEPSVIAIDTETKDVLAVGDEANKMLGRTPNKVKAIKPLKDGVIADFESAYKMLDEFIKKLNKKGIKKKTIIICCPANVTQVEKNAFYELVENLGAKKPVIKIGAEIPFTRYFYKYKKPENSENLLEEIKKLEENVYAKLNNLF